ncbi:MAG: nucleotidyltransferase family protein, partial [Candidatus Asgardarchaeia archaeon]
MKAVVLAAGKGKRLRPFTYTRPKPMMPVGGKPILEHTLTSLSKIGIRDVIIVVNYM